MIPTRPRLVFATSAALLALGLVGHAGQQAGQDIRGTQTGSVQFLAVTKDGQPIPDLRMDEVTLKIDNKMRPLKSLNFIKISSPIGAPGTSAAPPPAQAVAPAFATNVTASSDLPRSIVIIVDDESMPIGQEIKLRSSLTNFVKDLPPNDQVALVTVPHGGIKVGLTTDRERLRKEIANISPITPIDDASCRTLTTLGTLTSTLDMLTRSTDQPVAVAFLTTSLTGVSQTEQAPRPGVSSGSLSSAGGGCHSTNDDFARVGQAVAAARAQFYVINPDYNPGPVQDGVMHLLGQTGGELLHLNVGTEPGLYRIARETSAYYRATFDTEPDELLGKPHQSTVKILRPGVELRSHPFLVVGRATPETRMAVGPIVTTAFDIVRSGKPYRDLSLRATSSSFRNPNGTVNVHALFEPLDPSVKIMTAYAALIDDQGTAREVWQGEAKDFTAWPTVLGLTVKPGNYRLRIAAIDSNGRAGLVDDPIVAEIRQAGPLQVSGILLGVSPKPDTFMARLSFSKEPTVTAYLEMYGANEGTRAGAYIEVSNTTDGKAFITQPGVFAPTGEAGKYRITATIPIADLANGDYVVRAIVGADGQPATRVLRTLRKG